MSALGDGWRRVANARTLLVAVVMLNLAVALPWALSLDVERAALIDANAVDLPSQSASVAWGYELLSQAAGIGQGTATALLGVAVLIAAPSLRAGWDGLPVLMSATTALVLMTPFLLGGVIDRLARDRATGTHGFFAACGHFFLPMLRLTALAAPIHAAWFLGLYPAIASNFLITAIIMVPLLVATTALFDFAAVRLVVEDRRSAIGAVIGSLRFIVRHAGAVVGLCVFYAFLVVMVLSMFAGGRVTVGTLVGIIALRTAMRLAFVGSQTGLFQARLAHAGYTARPMPTWPESPAAEAIRPN